MSRGLYAIGPASLVVGVAAALAGCGSAGSAAGDAATAFYQAVKTGETSKACDLLAPETRRELEQTEKAACEDALTRVELPTVDQAVGAERFGLHAQVRFDNDTAFLAEYDNGWKVVAAGCTDRDPLPYDCVIEGG
jgi:hypothetical protein